MINIPFSPSSRFTRWALYAVLAIPLQTETGWHHLKYSDIPMNEVRFDKDGAHVSVKKSASPLIHLFGQSETIRAVHASGKMLGLPEIPDGKVDGGKDFDDFPVRIGFAQEGPSRLTWIDRLMAPPWLREIVNLDPERTLGQVHFLTISQRSLPGQIRQSSRNKLEEEVVVDRVQQPGDFKIDYEFHPPIQAFAIWLQSDGDDTFSTFDVVYSSLSLDIAHSNQ